MALLFAPFLRATDQANAPIPGAFATFYATGTSTLQPVWSEFTLSVALPNPVQADSNGVWPAIWLDDSLAAYKVVFQYPDVNNPTIPGALIAGPNGTIDPYNTTTSFDTTDAELAAGVVPVSKKYPPGDIRRYGAKFDGSDESVVVSNWLLVGGELTFPVPKTIVVVSAANLVSNTTVNAVKGAVIQTTTHDINILQATQQSNIIVRGLHFKQTSAGATAYVAHVVLDRCTNCVVEYCEFEGTQFYGIWGPGSTYCTYQYNYFHDALGKAESTCDIDLSSSTTPSRWNTVAFNTCWGGGEFGIACWDPYSGIIPARNIIIGNKVGGGNTGYGILLYFPTAGDSFNQVIGNTIQDVKGSIPSNPSSGTGIYGVGAGLGGTVISNNTVFNCCINTGNESLAPAGIGVNGTSAGSAPITVQGNVVSLMTQYHGIVITGCLGGCTVSGNTVNMPAANPNGIGIKIAISNNVSCVGNIVNLVTTTNPQVGIGLVADGAENTNITVSGNTVNGGHSSQIRTIQVGGHTNSGVVISGNHMTNGDASCTPLVFDSASAQNVMVANNNIRATTVAAITQTACPNIRYTGNFVLTTGTIALNFTGNNNLSFFDSANFGLAGDASVNNAGTGLTIDRLGTGAPTAGTWAVGDTIRNRAPSAAGVFQWICTTLGTGGGTAVFKTISNSA